MNVGCCQLLQAPLFGISLHLKFIGPPVLPLILCEGRGQETFLCGSKPRRESQLVAHLPGTTALQINAELMVRLFCLSAAALGDALSQSTLHLSVAVQGWCRSTLTHTLIPPGAVILGAPPAAGQPGCSPRPAARGDERELVTDGQCPLLHHSVHFSP